MLRSLSHALPEADTIPCTVPFANTDAIPCTVPFANPSSVAFPE